MNSPDNHISRSNSKSELDTGLSTNTYSLNENDAYFSLSYFYIDGVSQGNLSHLTFRPNSGLHPINSVNFDQEKLYLNFDQAIKPINRQINKQEILDLIEQLRHAERNVVLGQEFYLYPSALAFALNQKNELKVLLRNLHPRHEAEVKSCTQYTLRAVLDLIKQHRPALWSSIESNLKGIYTLEDLQQLIQPNSFLRILRVATWTLLVSLILLFMLSLPIAAYGPTQISSPLKELYYPIFMDFSQRLAPQPPKLKSSPTEKLEDLKTGEGNQIELKNIETIP